MFLLVFAALIILLPILKRIPSVRRNPVFQRLHLVIDLVFWLLLISYTAIFIWWLFFRRQ